jgi:hypothetical protein
VDPQPLIYASRMSAKVDNTALQDGYQLYHHIIIFSHTGDWSVVQQGMNQENRYARRYHWLSTSLKSFIEEPHTAILSQKEEITLNMVAKESRNARGKVVSLTKELTPERLLDEMKKVQRLNMPSRHHITMKDINIDRLKKGIIGVHERVPKDFQKLLETPRLGPKTLRALALTAEVLYGVPLSFKDPARFSFAHGGKDGYPFPVDKETYDSTIEALREITAKSRLSQIDKNKINKRLTTLTHNRI